MSEEIEQKIIECLKDHDWLNLGTVDKDGKPMVHTVAYASDGAVVYFSTAKTTRKVTNIENNPFVAYTVDDDKVNVMEITGVQMEGKASIVTDEEETGKVFDIMLEKFPFVKDIPAEVEHVLFKVEPVKAYYLDYTKGFAHRDMVSY
ncbi:pyridoxamine 5'-phosphate oxidase family protein [Methanolobus profundi]|uniref:General stress protein 26 n=1 Tax=Methanolobus profundi TaxID=487685 RepID=A0A1I4PJ46_9EURY|nr:pyridoxamine 5'-phosphate oxidase family protein [Methanolobus profundi]SFM27463.1 General stress protein 26 [Methanolobus profundi]